MGFKIISDGEEINCKIVMTFKDSQNNINYIVYQDGTKDADGKLENFASRFILEDGKYVLVPIQEEYEWELIDKVLEQKFKGDM